jgi:hypothetical protein
LGQSLNPLQVAQTDANSRKQMQKSARFSKNLQKKATKEKKVAVNFKG